MSTRIVLLNILGLSLLYAALNWNSFTMPFERDEGEYAYSAWLLREGNVPYKDSFLQKPPMIVYVYALGQILDPNSVVPPRLLASLFSILTVIFTGLVARELYGRKAGWLAMGISLPLSMLPLLLPYAANTEKFLLLPMVICLYIFVASGARARWWQWIVAGMSAAAAILFKPIAVLPLSILFFWWWGDTWLSEGTQWLAVRNAGLTAVGALIAGCIVLAYFVFRHAFSDLIECTFTYNYQYALAGSGQIRRLPGMFWSLFKQSWPAVFLLVFYVFHRSPRWILMSSLLLAAFAAASTDPNGHYYLLTVPFLAIMSASGLDSFLRWFLAKVQHEKRKRVLGFVVPAMIIGLLLVPSLERMVLQPEGLCSEVYRGNPFVESETVARHVRELCSPHDSIFVAGSEPQILFYAKRKSVTRFDIMYPLAIPTPLARQYQNDLERTLKNSRPSVVVFSTAGASWFNESNVPRECVDIVRRSLESGHYRVVGGYVRSQAGEGWKEPLGKEDITQCTLIVFKRERIGPT